MKITPLTAIAVIAILTLGYFYIYDVTPSELGVVPFQPGATTQYVIGFTYADNNAIDGSSESTSSPYYLFFNSDGRRLNNLGASGLYGEASTSIASGTSATNVIVYPTDGDYLFVNVDTGTTHYPDPAKFLASNPAFTTCSWFPVSTRNVPELVCEMQISRLGVPNYQVSPSLVGHLKVPALPDDVGITLSSPADQTGVGTTSGTDVYVTWTGSALAANEGWAFAKIWITSNQTALDHAPLSLTITSSSSIVKMSDTSTQTVLYIPGAYAVSGTAGGIDQTWRYWPATESLSTDFTNTLLVGRGSGDADSLQFMLHTQTFFTSSGHGATIVLNVQLITAGNALQSSTTDSMTISA